MQLKEEALVLILGAIPGSCAAESENILVGFSSQGGSVKMRDLKVEWGGGGEVGACHSCGELQTSFWLMRGI